MLRTAAMHVALPESESPVKLVLDPEHPFTDDQYFAFCAANSNLRIERTAQGEIVIVPPAGGESDYRNTQLVTRLTMWAMQDGRGTAFGSSVEFILPSSAALSPDAAWVSREKIGRLTKEERRKFLRLDPDFVAEVMSPSDRLPAMQAKMEEWIANGVLLGWLIDGDAQTVYVYRIGKPMEKLTGTTSLAGDGPIAGFVLDLTAIWAGL
jgi:Uma2 family endonuclease